MLHLDLTLEDNRIIATRGKENTWIGHIMDNPTGHQLPICWTDEEIGAVAALALGVVEHGQPGSMDAPDIVARDLSKIAERAVLGLPPELRPIP